jgi:hypothetical protein
LRSGDDDASVVVGIRDEKTHQSGGRSCGAEARRRQKNPRLGGWITRMTMRRVRGRLLRLARRRWPATALGLALLAPAAWLELGGRFSAWWIDGLSLVLGATGLAFVWTGLAGPRPDWFES